MRQFYDWLGDRCAKGIRLAVMDMWKPATENTHVNAPGALKKHEIYPLTEQAGK
jgi:hypothetical protein